VNSNLYNKTIELPKEVVEYLQTCFDHIPNSDPSIEESELGISSKQV
jgi:hypothetical protein